MAKYNIDTDKMKEASANINVCISDIEVLIGNMVKRFDNMPNETKEWQGNASEDFVSVVDDQYQNIYKPFIELLKTYSKNLKNAAEDFEVLESNNRL